MQNNCISIGNVKLCGTRGWIFPESNSEQKEEDKKIFNREIERLKISVKKMQELREKGDIVIGMMHYPPFNTKWEDSPFTEIFNLNNINTMVYGHIHGKNSSYKKVIKKGELSCHICSCDLLDNMPVLIGEV